MNLALWNPNSYCCGHSVADNGGIAFLTETNQDFKVRITCTVDPWKLYMRRSSMDSAAINRLYLKRIVELAHRFKKGFR
jgi:hypothetical protein